ncbi:MAG: hypothetical protein E7292_04425 [Lachnospiraceae bacterium]|nr:hypothetical protein [Lachnospiraceae bacterium]
MAMRLSGLMSGMDTESLIAQLVEAKSTKVNTAKKQQIRHNWKQDAWKDLNTKLKNLQSKYIANMRFQSSYSKKTTKVSNESAVSVITGENAVNGVQNLEIKQLAKTGYLTGAELKAADGTTKGDYTALSKLSDLGVTDGGTFSIKSASGTVDVNFTADTTISDVLTQLKDAGLNATFDAKNQRFFVSAKESGVANDFEITASDANGTAALAALGLQVGNNADGSGATKIAGQDAIINLNGAQFTSNTNVFEINGLTFTALNETKVGESITVTTQNDTDGIYDMVKNFLKEYNSVINEMDKLYNAESSRGYEPLLSEEKEALSETEAEEYEKKIKDSILRRDDNLESVSSTLKNAMMSGIEVNGKTMYLSNFGINTLGYFTSADNEHNAYHIDGDPDDESTAGNADKLKSMISSDPETVISFFSQLSQNLYDKMSDMSKSVEGYRSFGSFYDDKKMKTDYDSYTSKIAELEEKLNDYEDKWYAKFAEMETAMAKMQSNASAVTGLLGG